MSLEVICVGMGRTGTESLRLALIELGFDPCHHMVELRAQPELVEPWREITANGAGGADWSTIFEGFKAQADWPGAHYWREITRAYPDAKVILSVRSAKSWYKSFASTILPFMALKGRHDPPHRNDIAEICERMFAEAFDGRQEDPDYAMKCFETHNQAVIETIDADRLLVLPVGSGWVPLCKHLGVPVPDTPYPSGNTTADFNARIAANLVD